jgi:hypothetical protein
VAEEAFLIGGAIAIASSTSTNDSYDDSNDKKRLQHCHQGLIGSFDKTPSHPHVVSL